MSEYDEIYEDGYSAGYTLYEYDNPYPKGSEKGKMWKTGYIQGENDILLEIEEDYPET